MWHYIIEIRLLNIIIKDPFLKIHLSRDYSSIRKFNIYTEIGFLGKLFEGI